MYASRTRGRVHGGSRSSVVFLDKEKGLFPAPNHASQEHHEKPVRLPVNWSLDLSMEDDELLSYQCVFRDQFRLLPEKISECAEQKGSRRCVDPKQKTFLERVKAEANALLDSDD